jgi:hypothetical protein
LSPGNVSEIGKVYFDLVAGFVVVGTQSINKQKALPYFDGDDRAVRQRYFGC